MNFASAWKLIKEYAKTIAAFVAGVLGNVVINLINGTTPWPQTGDQWVQLAVASFGPAIATWLATNKITQKQLDADKNVIGGVVVPDAQIPPPGPPTSWAAGGPGGATGVILPQMRPGEFLPPWPKPTQ